MDNNRLTLEELMAENPQANDYFNTLHPVVQQRLLDIPDQIGTLEDLYAFANNAMTETLEEFRSPYDDGDTYPQ